MKIIERQNEIPFSNLFYGAVFQFSGLYYIKSDIADSKTNAISLDDGSACYFNDTDNVFSAHATLRVTAVNEGN